MQAIWSASQIQGGRDYQEDFLGVIENNSAIALGKKQLLEDGALPAHQSLYLLADGMGGMGHGDLAASTVVDVFMASFLENIAEGLDIRTSLRQALHRSNQAILDMITAEPEQSGMGCTLIALLWDSHLATVTWISVGDSLLGIQRDGRWLALNEKHIWRNLAKKKRAAGEVLDEEEIERIGGALYSAIDGSELSAIDQADLSIQQNDVIIIASDGLEVLSEDMIEQTINTSLKDAAEGVEINDAFNTVEGIRSSLFSGVEEQNNHHQDNTSVISIGFFNGLA